MKNLKELPQMPTPEIIGLIQDGLNILIQGFQNIGFRKKTNERLAALEKQVAILSQHILNEAQ